MVVPTSSSTQQNELVAFNNKVSTNTTVRCIKAYAQYINHNGRMRAVYADMDAEKSTALTAAYNALIDLHETSTEEHQDLIQALVPDFNY